MSAPPKLLYPLHDYPQYRPRDSIALAAKAAFPSFGVGLVTATTIERVKRAHSALIPAGIRIAKGSFLIGSLGATFAFTEAASSNLREKDDGWNSVIAGSITGALAGIPNGTITRVAFSSLFLGGIMGFAGYTGGLFGSVRSLPEDSHFKQDSDIFQLRHRVPLSETISKLGEGRGIVYPTVNEQGNDQSD